MTESAQNPGLQPRPRPLPELLGELAARANAAKPSFAPQDGVPQHPVTAILGHLQQPKTEREEAMRTLRANVFMAP